jgi:hypothetical protein
MLRQRSTPFAKRTERPRLAPPWAIAAIFAFIVALLVLMFPQRALIKRIVASSEQSELATAYLVNLLRTEPDNPDLRLVLARQQYRLGQLGAAEKTLRVSMTSRQQSVREDSAWLLWTIRVREFERLDAESPQRPQALAALRRELLQLADEHWGEAMTLDLARRALTIGESELGLHLLRDLGERRSDLGPDWFNHAARETLGQGQYRVASELYFVARAHAITVDERRQAYIAGLRALQQGNLMADAVAAGERELKDLGEDREALYALVEVARAANRIDIADKYARRMLRLSLLGKWPLAVAGASAGWHFRLVASNADDTAQLPFDDKVYRLGYEVFLNNRKPEDAYRVAAAAVRQAPQDLAWRERLARVAEWSGKPRVALENWLFLAKHGGDDVYWQHVLRLAPGLFEDEALLSALQYQLAKTPDAGKWQSALVDTFERLGRPADGLKYLQQLQRRSGNPDLLEAIANLAERSGDYAAALTAWRQRLQSDAPTAAQALRAATLMLQMGRLDEARQVLERARLQAQETDAAYWRLTGELARRQQQNAAALDAYQRLIGGGMAEAGDYAAAVDILRDAQPLSAARVAAAGWRKFHRLDLYRTALTLLAGQGNWREFGDLLAEPDARSRAELQRQADFLRARAEYFQHRGDIRSARRDLEAALVIAPEAAGLRQALLWLAIDGNDAVAVRRMLTRWEKEWADDPAMHDVLAAAWQSLSLPQTALDRYLTPHLDEHRGDFLWLMNYADALEQNHEADRAWSLRRSLWQHAENQRGLDERFDAALAGARRIARSRLEMTLGAGEGRLAALHDLLRLDRDADGKPTAAAREAVLAWLQDAGEYSAERGYLWQQYGSNLARPLWADISTALAADDVDALGELLERGGERLSRYDRINTAARSGDWRSAQSDAFDTSEQQRNDDELQQQLSDTLLQFSDSVAATATARDLGAIAEQERDVGAECALNPNLRLAVELSRIRRGLRDANALVKVPEIEDAGTARLRLRRNDAESSISLATRNSLRAYRPALLEHSQTLGNGLSLHAGLGLHLAATESSALRVAGMKDQVDWTLRYQISQRERLSLQWSDAHYLGQTGSLLGRGSAWQTELAIPIKLGTPDLECSGFAARYRFERFQGVSDAALQALIPATSGLSVTDLFIPSGFRYYGMRLSSNMRYQGVAGDYTRAFRPYASLALTHHSDLGAGYDLAFGLSGSIAGGDRLSLGYSLAKGGTGNYGHVRELGLYYQQQF